MIKIAIIIGSTRPGRKAEAVARWVFDQAQKRRDAVFELVDVADYQLPLLDEAEPPASHEYTKAHTLAWSAAIEPFDGFIFVTPEYNHSIPAALKNAIDYLYDEWVDKAAGFVSYGTAGGVRSVEHLRQVMGELQIADVRSHVKLLLHDDFIDYEDFAPSEHHLEDLESLFNQLVAWSGALQRLRLS